MMVMRMTLDLVQLHATHNLLAPQWGNGAMGQWGDAIPDASIIPDVAGSEQAARVGRKMEIAGFRRYVRLVKTNMNGASWCWTAGRCMR